MAVSTAASQLARAQHRVPSHCDVAWTIDRSSTDHRHYLPVTKESPHVSTILTFTPTEPGAPLQMPLRSYLLPK
jgi:hypothetical protein